MPRAQLIEGDNQCPSMVPNKPRTWMGDPTTYRPIVADNDITISRSSSKLQVCHENVRARTMLRPFSKTPQKKAWTHHCFTKETLLRGSSPRTSFCSAIYQYALKAPESTVMKPNYRGGVSWAGIKPDKTYEGLSALLDILYSYSNSAHPLCC